MAKKVKKIRFDNKEISRLFLQLRKCFESLQKIKNGE